MEYRVHQPGDILQLRGDLPDVYAGFYVLLSCGDAFGLAVLGKDEAGNLCATSTQVSVSARDVYRSVIFRQAVNPLSTISAPDQTEGPRKP
jgi:hypothetical protein